MKVMMKAQEAGLGNQVIEDHFNKNKTLTL